MNRCPGTGTHDTHSGIQVVSPIGEKWEGEAGEAPAEPVFPDGGGSARASPSQIETRAGFVTA
jgi:hypothetical protein